MNMFYSFLVSGSKKDRIAPKIAKLSIINKGNGFHNVARDSMRKPKNPPILPIIDPIPTVVLLTIYSV